jgi:hypothetical protein
MNVDDFNAWWAQIDMADNLKECARIKDALFVSGKKYEELPVAESMLVDHLYSREVKLRTINFKSWEGVGSAVVNPRANRFFEPSFVFNPVVHAAVRTIAEAPITVIEEKDE